MMRTPLIDADTALDTNSLIDVYLARNEASTDLQEAMAALEDALDAFARRHLDSIREFHRKAKLRGGSAKVGDVTCMTFCMAGRIMVTLHRGNRQVTGMAIESPELPSDHGIGLHGINGSLRTARGIIDQALDQELAWFEDANLMVM